MSTESATAQELREIFRSRVNERFMDARICLMRARVAHQGGDHAELRKWMRSVRVFRTAAARWRRRAEKLAPMLVCLVCFLHGCSIPPVRVTDSLTVPPAAIRPVCDKLSFNHAPRDAHWSGYAELVWDSDGGRVVAIDCGLMSVSADWAPLSERFSIQCEDARDLREFLTANGIEFNDAQ
jgi:hypothetical protein